MTLGRYERLTILRTGAASTALLLAACGGGGGTNSAGSAPPPVASPMPTPAPTPSPTPTPPPPPTRSAEYSASGAAVGMKAGAAYDRGLTGKGVTIAVVDTGIDVQGSEFQGRISPDSRAFETVIARCRTCAPETVTFELDDVKGHGTQTASVALAAKNGQGPHGVAYEATLLALKVSAPDLNGVTETSVVGEGDGANPAQIGTALAYAVDKGAFVASMSLNGEAAGDIALAQRAGMDRVRAADRLMVVSVSNGTDDDSAAEGTIVRNLVGSDLANKEWFLFGIGVDSNLRPRSANGLPGVLADRTLAAVANGVTVVNKDGGTETVTGNSFAAPAIAGAAAILKQNWPQLGGKAISRILLDTATDMGDPGVDQRFGVGLLNLERALQAQAPALGATLSSASPLDTTSLVASAPFGGTTAADRLRAGLGGLVAVDRYGRDYRFDGAGLVGSRGSALLAGGMTRPLAPVWTPTPATHAAALVGSGSRAHRPTSAVGFGFSPAQGQTVIVTANDAAESHAAGLTGSLFRTAGAPQAGTTLAWTVGRWRSTAVSARSPDGRTHLTSIAIAAPLGVELTVTELDERGRALGLAGSGAFAIRGGRTRLVTVGGSASLAGFQLAGRAVLGATRVDAGRGLLRFDREVTSSAFSGEVSRLLLGGRASLALTSPLRVDRARASLTAPVGFDIGAGDLVTETRRIDLAPDAREVAVEIGWSAMLSPGSSVRLGIARSHDAAHVPGARDTAGFATLVIR